MWTLYFNIRVRITAQIFRPDLGPVRLPLLPHLVAHVLINRNLLTSYVSVFIRKNILNSFLSWSKSLETNPCFSASHGFTQHFLFLVFKTLLCFVLSFIHCEHAATTQKVPIFFNCLFVTSHTLHVTLFASTFIKNFFWSSVFKFVFRHSSFKKTKIHLQKTMKKYGKL